MWTKRKDVLNIANQYLEDVTVEEISQFAKTLKLEISKEEIIDWLTAEAAKQGVSLNEDDRKQLPAVETEKAKIIKRFIRNNSHVDVKQKYKFNEKVYNGYEKNLKDYSHNCRILTIVLNVLSDPKWNIEKQQEIFDLQVKDDCIATIDLLRILKPLKVCYRRAKKIKDIAENPASYMNKSGPPSTWENGPRITHSGVVCQSVSGFTDEDVQPTEKQLEQLRRKKEDIVKRAIDSYNKN